MSEKAIYTVCCSRCGKVLGKSFEGTKTYTRCPKCKTDVFYEVLEDGPRIKIIKDSGKMPRTPLVPV